MLELITMGPGGSLFDGFGHAALRLVDEQAGTDRVFTFGAVRWTGPLLGWRFLRGEVLFEARARPWSKVLQSYRRQDRSIYRQQLLLTPQESRWLADRLELSIRPENARYRYHHFQDNCSTRLRDLIDEATGGGLRPALMLPDDGSTHRDHVLEGLALNPLVLLVMNVVLGRSTDRPLDRWDAAFVPARLRTGLALASRTVDGRQVPLAAPVELVYARRQALKRWPTVWGEIPAYLAAALAAVSTLGFLLPRKAIRGGARTGERPPAWGGPRLLGALALAWALIGGLLGLILDTVALSDYVPEFQRNENLFLFTLLDLLLVVPAASWLSGRLRPLLPGVVLAWLALRTCGAALVLTGQLTGLLVQRPLALALFALCVNGLLLTAALRLAGQDRQIAELSSQAAATSGASCRRNEPMKAGRVVKSK